MKKLYSKNPGWTGGELMGYNIVGVLWDTEELYVSVDMFWQFQDRMLIDGTYPHILNQIYEEVI